MKLLAKEIKRKYRVIGIGYAKAQNLLKYQKRVGYTSSPTYGWRSDNFLIDLEDGSLPIMISTGYGYVENGIKVDTEILRKYEKDAERINYENFSWETKKETIHELLVDFIKETLRANKL